MVESLQKRGKLLESAALTTDLETIIDRQGEIDNVPSRLLLHNLIRQMKIQLVQLNRQNLNGNQNSINKQAITDQLNLLLHTVTHLAEFGFPLDLNLKSTDIHALLYETLTSFQAEFIRRHINLELNIDPEIQPVIVDRLKLRKALRQLINNALATLPETGGRISIFANVKDGSSLLIAINDNGTGIKHFLLEPVFNDKEIISEDGKGHSPIGRKLTKAIVEHHGGKLVFKSNPGQGTQAELNLPILNAIAPAQYPLIV